MAFDIKNLESALNHNLIPMSIIAAILMVPIFWFIMWLRKEKMLIFCGFSRINIRNITFTAMIGIALVLPVDFITTFFSIDKISPSTQQMFNMIFTQSSFPVLLLGIGIIGPILEEILFRGLIFNELRKNMPTFLAIILQGLLFGSMHMNWTQFLYAAPLGIIFGFIYIWTKSIWSTILVHIFFNSTSIILQQFFNEQTLITKFYVALSFVLALILIVIIWIDRNKSEKLIDR